MKEAKKASRKKPRLKINLHKKTDTRVLKRGFSFFQIGKGRGMAVTKSPASRLRGLCGLFLPAWRLLRAAKPPRPRLPSPGLPAPAIPQSCLPRRLRCRPWKELNSRKAVQRLFHLAWPPRSTRLLKPWLPSTCAHTLLPRPTGRTGSRPPATLSALTFPPDEASRQLQPLTSLTNFLPSPTSAAHPRRSTEEY